MLKATASMDTGAELIVFGLSARNIELLKQGRPVSFDLPIHGRAVRFLIFYGDTEDAMHQELAEFIGSETHVKDSRQKE